MFHDTRMWTWDAMWLPSHSQGILTGQQAVTKHLSLLVTSIVPPKFLPLVSREWRNGVQL